MGLIKFASSWKASAMSAVAWGIVLVLHFLNSERSALDIVISTWWVGWFSWHSLHRWKEEVVQWEKEQLMEAIIAYYLDATPLPIEVQLKLGLDFDSDPNGSDAVLRVIIPEEFASLGINIFLLYSEGNYLELFRGRGSTPPAEVKADCYFFSGSYYLKCAVNPGEPCNSCHEFKPLQKYN